MYRGEWINDVKHGKGELFLPNGTIIATTWDHDKMNGKGIITEAGGKKIQATYYNDLEVKMSD